MAGDWIKMRVSLRRDPKVIRMAETLAGDEHFQAWLVAQFLPVTGTVTRVTRVTPTITRALCVAGLLEVWGVAREKGRRENDDLILSSCSFFTIDEIGSLPGLGRAMAEVQWAVSRENTMVFPRFFVEKESPEQRYRTPAAERQARYRDRKKEGITERNAPVTRDVTRYNREEKRRVDGVGLNTGAPSHPPEPLARAITPNAEDSQKGNGVGGGGLDRWPSMRAVLDEKARAIAKDSELAREMPGAIVAHLLKFVGMGNLANKATPRTDLTPDKFCALWQQALLDASTGAVHDPVAILATRLQLKPPKSKGRK